MQSDKDVPEILLLVERISMILVREHGMNTTNSTILAHSSSINSICPTLHWYRDLIKGLTNGLGGHVSAAYWLHIVLVSDVTLQRRSKSRSSSPNNHRYTNGYV